MIDDQVVGVSSEERFSRIKNDEGIQKAIEYLLNKHRIKRNQITYVCFISNFWSPYTL